MSFLLDPSSSALNDHSRLAGGPTQCRMCAARNTNAASLCSRFYVVKLEKAGQPRLAMPLPACAMAGQRGGLVQSSRGAASKTLLRHRTASARLRSSCGREAPLRTGSGRALFELPQVLPGLLGALINVRSNTALLQRLAELHAQEPARRVAGHPRVEVIRQPLHHVRVRLDHIREDAKPVIVDDGINFPVQR